jgi:hypothetical protein
VAWALDAGIPLPRGMEEYATLVSDTRSKARVLLAAPTDPFTCKGIALGFFVSVPVLIVGDAALHLPAPPVTTYFGIRESRVPSAPFLEQPDPPPRPFSFC